MSMTTGNAIPILQSSLPPLERMLPYLQQIEGNRCHSNFGKLFRLFEERMAEFFGLSVDEVVIMCNGTQALICGLLAIDNLHDKYCLMPSWTFSATPASAKLAGMIPYFLDVDLQSQTLTVTKVREFLNRGEIDQEKIGAVMVVSPFGYPINREEWDQFTHETGIPVFIDAAASFDAIHRQPIMAPGFTPMMISFHATKIFGIGEGGILISNQKEFIKRVKGITNFGFDVSRESTYLGMNAKMSEYQAGIGLAVLDSWDEIREKRFDTTSRYISMFNQLGLKHWLSTNWLSSNCNVLLPGQAQKARDYLVAHQIESRIWWNKGCHTYPAYRAYPREMHLPHTERLSNTMLGLPFSIDISNEQLQRIAKKLADFLSQSSSLSHQQTEACAIAET